MSIFRLLWNELKWKLSWTDIVLFPGHLWNVSGILVRTQTLNLCLCEIKFVKVCVNKIEFMNKFQSFLLIQGYEIKELLFINYDISNISTINSKSIWFIILSCFTLYWSRPIYNKLFHKQPYIYSHYYNMSSKLKVRGLCHL